MDEKVSIYKFDPHIIMDHNTITCLCNIPHIDIVKLGLTRFTIFVIFDPEHHYNRLIDICFESKIRKIVYHYIPHLLYKNGL